MDLSNTLSAPSDGALASLYDDVLASLAEAAAARRFDTAPNPSVGAAILSDGIEIGRGLHSHWGGPHAELLALEAAAKSGVPPARWDTLVVTLEPCSSHGKTPPCTEAIRAAGIRRVVVGAVDPDPRHRGRGMRELHEAGLEVELRSPGTPLQRVSPHFLMWTTPDRIRRPRPWTIAKWAQTRTGQLSPPEGTGDRRISGPEAHDDVQVLRGRVDAIAVGRGTVQADDPRLTVRPPGALDAPPLRVVLDTELRISPDARLFAPCGPDESGGPVHVFCRGGAPPARYRALAAAGAEIHTLRTGDDGRLSLRDLQSWLWGVGVRRLLLEAGPTLLESWFELGLVDQIKVYTGSVNGGRGSSLGKWLEASRLTGVERSEVGGDALLQAFVP